MTLASKKSVAVIVVLFASLVWIVSTFSKVAHAVSCNNSFSTDPTRNLGADIEQAWQMGYDCIVLASGTYTSPVAVDGISNFSIVTTGSVIVDAEFTILDSNIISVANLGFRKKSRFTNVSNLTIINTTHEDTLYLNDQGDEFARSTNVSLSDVLTGLLTMPNWARCSSAWL